MRPLRRRLSRLLFPLSLRRLFPIGRLKSSFLNGFPEFARPGDRMVVATVKDCHAADKGRKPARIGLCVIDQEQEVGSVRDSVIVGDPDWLRGRA